MKLPFGKRDKGSGRPEFSATPQGDQIVLNLGAEGSPAPFEDWTILRPDAAGAVAECRAAGDDIRMGRDGRPLVEVSDNQLVLHPAFVASLDAASAAILGLPAETVLGLDLKAVGRADQDTFHVQWRWVRPGGLPARATIQGALLSTSDGLRRVPEPLWSLFQAARSLEQPLPSEQRYQALSDLGRAWPEMSDATVLSDGYLKDLRVHYASTLSLTIKSLTPSRTDFDPILFGGRSLEQAQQEGRTPDEELDNVLTPASQKLFAEDRFRREPRARPAYVLRNGEYIVIDPALQPALDQVRVLQDRPEAERREFVLNPRRILRERLGDEKADAIDVDRLFVETEQFSERVAGVDIWRAPVMPWLTPSTKNQWIPERFGLRIGDDYFSLAPENVAAVIQNVTSAAEAGEALASVEGLLQPMAGDSPAPTHIPVTPQVVEAVQSFAPFAAHPSIDVDGVAEPPSDWDPAQGKLFLVVRENLDEVEYQSSATPDGATERKFDPPVVSERLKTALKAHQKEGVAWLAHCARVGRPGALLADDMGLGKTLQAITFMAWLQDQADAGERPSAPFLIVAPTGLLGTWKEEIAKHLDLPRLGHLVPAFGSDLRALREEDTLGIKDIESGRAALKAENWRDAGVVLTTYETLRDYHFSFARTRFGLIIYDEIQKLKNPASQLSRAAKALNSTFTLGMTGTPVENRLQDLWSIMDVVSPGLLGSSREFERRHPPTDLEALSALKRQLTGAPEGRPPYMLRRMKADALSDMPEKQIHTAEISMPAVQATAYKDLVLRAAAGSAGGNLGKGGMLTILASMRGISLHPLDPRLAPPDLNAYARDSARLSHTLGLLEEIEKRGEKVLVFVEDLAMQERLAGLIKSRFQLDMAPMRISGSVPGHKRQALVNAFQTGGDRFDVMILSPKAGGVGLTLTAANHVIHLSRWWNPAVEDQATDRVFRIGQKRKVHVYLPLAVHPDPAIRETSFDLRLNALIERKRNLTRDLFFPPDANDDELSDLFREVSLGGNAEEPDQRRSENPEANLPQDAKSPAPPVDLSEPRPTLTLPKVIVDGGVKRWRREAGEARPTEEIISLFEGKDIELVRITDPYAITSASSRSAQVTFLKALHGASRRIGQVVIEYAPEADGDADESVMRSSLGSLYSRAIPPNSTPLNFIRRPKRGRDDDFHDRFVEIDIRHAGGAVRRHELSIGRGLMALYDNSKQCTITYAPPAN